MPWNSPSTNTNAGGGPVGVGEVAVTAGTDVSAAGSGCSMVVGPGCVVDVGTGCVVGAGCVVGTGGVVDATGDCEVVVVSASVEEPACD
jgi:hypothetical protein